MNIRIFIETTFSGVKGRSRVERMFGCFLLVPMWRPCFIKDLRLRYQSPSALSRRGRSGRDGQRRSSRDRKTERCCRQVFPTTPSPTDASGSFCPLSHSASPLLHSFFHFSSSKRFTLSKSSAWRKAEEDTSPLCLSVTPPAEAIITFHSSIKGSQL